MSIPALSCLHSNSISRDARLQLSIHSQPLPHNLEITLTVLRSALGRIADYRHPEIKAFRVLVFEKCSNFLLLQNVG